MARSQSASEETAQKVAAQVRHAVYAEREHLDDLVRVLDRNYGKAVDVSPAMQWAQNSTHIFIAIKFCKRWNAPGALEVKNETVDFSSCCFNFTAFGEHSMILRRYHLSLELFRKVDASASSWFFAAAGRVTVTIAKTAPANWPRLLLTESKTQNLGIWRDMRDKWKEDTEKLPPLETESKKKAAAAAAAAPSSAGSGSAAVDKKASSKKRKGKKTDADDDDNEDALDKEVEQIGECPKSSFGSTSVAELCAKSFRDVVEKPSVPNRRWLVELYSSAGDGDLEAMRKLMPTWKRLADVFPSTAPGGRIGAVDCGQNKDLCKKLGATKLPQIRRFAGSAVGDSHMGAVWSGPIDASMEELATWGSGKMEL